MCPGNRRSNNANVPWEWDYPMCPGIGTNQCALGMGLSNVPWEWDYPMRLALGMGLNVPWE